MEYVPRESWQTEGYPVDGPDSTPAEWEYCTLHWPGSVINTADPVGTLQGMQASWVNNKDYSLGYNWSVWPDGSIYEIRGWDIRCAANGSQEVNRPSVAILLAVPDLDTPPTTAMVEGVRTIIDEARLIAGKTLYINGHRDVRPEPTQCPGDVIYSMIAEGAFEPGGATPPPQPEPEPEPTPPPEEDWMAQLPTIDKGATGDYVERMQHLLAAAGYMNPANTANYDGDWGDGTDEAKRRFDVDHNLLPSPPTTCGTKSWESLLTGRVW